jgi:hypothetical protein
VWIERVSISPYARRKLVAIGSPEPSIALLRIVAALSEVEHQEDIGDELLRGGV